MHRVPVAQAAFHEAEGAVRDDAPGSGPGAAVGLQTAPVDRQERREGEQVREVRAGGLEADLERYIQAARRSNWQATEISAALRESSRPGVVMEPLLDEIAFETKVDI